VESPSGDRARTRRPEKPVAAVEDRLRERLFGSSDLLARIPSSGVRVVSVERAHRLARDLIVGELILNQFRDLGVEG
jgi:hypothetical protein